MDRQEALEIVRETMRRLSSQQEIPSGLEVDSISGATNIDELGLDSLDKLAVIQELERVTGATISDDRVRDLVTAGDLAQCITD